MNIKYQDLSISWIKLKEIKWSSKKKKNIWFSLECNIFQKLSLPLYSHTAMMGVFSLIVLLKQAGLDNTQSISVMMYNQMLCITQNAFLKKIIMWLYLHTLIRDTESSWTYTTLTHSWPSWLHFTVIIKHRSSIPLKLRAATEVPYLNQNYFKFETLYIFKCIQCLVWI